MDFEIRNGPAFAVGRCTLGPGEQMKAGAGAMMAHSIGVELEAKVQGGLMKGLKRSILGGESLFMTTWTAPETGGWVDVAANLPGDLAVLDVDGEMNVTQGGWLASSIEIETRHQVGRLQERLRRRGRLPHPLQRHGQDRRRLLRGDRAARARRRREGGPRLRPPGRLRSLGRVHHPQSDQGHRADAEKRRGLRDGVHRPRPHPHPDPQPAGPDRLADPGLPFSREN